MKFVEFIKNMEGRWIRLFVDDGPSTNDDGPCNYFDGKPKVHDDFVELQLVGGVHVGIPFECVSCVLVLREQDEITIDHMEKVSERSKVK